MKNRFLALLLVPISCIFLWVGCGPYSGQPSYSFGIEYDFTQGIIKVDHDIEEENFIFHYSEKDYSSHYFFYFVFTYNTVEKLINSTEFEYVDDDGNEIVYDKNGYYAFIGDKIIYISYKNSSEEIKAAIASEQFNISVGCGIFRVPVRGYESDS